MYVQIRQREKVWNILPEAQQPHFRFQPQLGNGRFNLPARGAIADEHQPGTRMMGGDFCKELNQRQLILPRLQRANADEDDIIG